MNKYLKTAALTTKLMLLIVPLLVSNGYIFEGFKLEGVATINELIALLGDDYRLQLVKRLIRHGILIDALEMGVKLF